MNTPNVETALRLLGPTLAIDSSLGTSVAASDGTRLVTKSVDDPLSHAEVVATLTLEALKALNLRPAEVQAVVCGIGPGPFTGLRVGIAAAQGFAAARGVPLLPLVSHDAVAFAEFTADSGRSALRVTTDARRRELFVTSYARPDSDGIPVRDAAPALFRNDDPTVTEDPNRVNPSRVDAADLLVLAALRNAAQRGFEAPGALYLRSPDVTPSQSPKRVTS